MSIANSASPTTKQLSSAFESMPAKHVDEAVQSVQDLVSPVWPLRDYVAVNPYAGLSDLKFMEARRRLALMTDCQMLMPQSYYQNRYHEGHFGLQELELAIDEMVADQIPGAETLSASGILRMLQAAEESSLAESSPAETDAAADADVRLWTVSQYYDRYSKTDWSSKITDEISKHCAAHYDQGQASWSSPSKALPLYQAWQSSAKLDRRMELLGLTGFRQLVGSLACTPEAAIAQLLGELEVPQSIWQEYLFASAMTIPGWSAWTKHQTVESLKQGFDSSDFAGLLAIRMAYDVGISRRFDFQVDFHSVAASLARSWSTSQRDPESDSLLNLTLLRANEVAIRNSIISGIQNGQSDAEVPSSATSASTQRSLAQMVFCIDVRSERIRRQLESIPSQIETFGFAGFFGLPFEYVRMGDKQGTNQLPVLVDPKFRVYEEVRSDEVSDAVPANQTALMSRGRIRGLRQMWKRFQSSAVSCFAFVEATGLFYSYQLASRLLGRTGTDVRFDGVDATEQDRLGPGFRNLDRQGISQNHLIDIAESILRGIGLTNDFARLVVLCGHAATTENNPLQAGLDCGACAGHSGEANARFGAMLLNKPFVRRGLRQRGIGIGDDVHFLAGLHNTTTDEIRFFDRDLVPESHQGFLGELDRAVAQAGQLTREERLPLLPGSTADSLIRRSVDWSEVRPEWGLTGNAAFIVGPRSLTQSVNLNGESFLHSYDFRNDTEGQGLEQIMTAPLVVANMINMQYYASTVDQKHFGSGSKTIHNVVGKFGVLSGNGGDLTTGLPWQSIHNGTSYEHDPVRLLAIIEAPRSWIDRILTDHQNVRDLVINGWINLVALDGQSFYRHTESGEWQQLDVGNLDVEPAFQASAN